MMPPGYVLGQVAAPRPEEPEEPLYVNAKQVSLDRVFYYNRSFSAVDPGIWIHGLFFSFLTVWVLLSSKQQFPSARQLRPFPVPSRPCRFSLFLASRSTSSTTNGTFGDIGVLFWIRSRRFLTPLLLPLYYFFSLMSAICFLRDPEQKKDRK